MELYNKILETIKGLDDREIMYIWNEYCYNTNNYDNEILTDAAFEELVENSSEGALFWMNRIFFGTDEGREDSSANPNRNYFCFNAYGNVRSFDYIYNQYSDEFYNIDVDSLVDYIVSNNDSLNCSDIAEILEEAGEIEA